MEALLTQGNSKKCKVRFNTAFLAGSDYSSLPMKNELNQAVLGTGVIANEMAQALSKMGKNLYAVGNRTQEKTGI